jgi:hypothetical protein
MATTHSRTRVDIPVLNEALMMAVRDEDCADGLVFWILTRNCPHYSSRPLYTLQG